MEGFSTKHAVGYIIGILRLDFCMDVVYDERHGWIGDRGNESSHAWKARCRQLRHPLNGLQTSLLKSSPTKERFKLSVPSIVYEYWRHFSWISN